MEDTRKEVEKEERKKNGNRQGRVRREEEEQNTRVLVPRSDRNRIRVYWSTGTEYEGIGRQEQNTRVLVDSNRLRGYWSTGTEYEVLVSRSNGIT